MTELFTIPPMPSPRQRWIAKHKLRIFKAAAIADYDEPWTCHAMNARVERGEYAIGQTEDDALANWAIKYGNRLWNEGGL